MESSLPTEYGSLDLAGWPWQDIYPCPITGCWLYDGNIVLPETFCGQPACCNPSHQVGGDPARIWPSR